MFELLTDEDFQDLPEDDGHRWLELQRTARRRMEGLLEGGALDARTKAIYRHYMTTVATAADRLGVQDVTARYNSDAEADLRLFDIEVNQAATRIRLDSLATFTTPIVRLTGTTKNQISQLLDEILERSKGLTLTKRQGKELERLVEDLWSEIYRPLTRFSRVGVILSSAIMLYMSSTASTAEDASEFTEIMRLIGTDYDASAERPILIEDHNRNQVVLPPNETKLLTSDKNKGDTDVED